MPNVMVPPAEYRIDGALCSTPQFDCPLLECRAVTLPRRESRWNLQGCPKLANRSQPLRPIRTTRIRKLIYGPYKSPVKSQNIYLQTLRHYWLFLQSKHLEFHKHSCGIKKSTSRRDHCRPTTVCPSIAENTQRHLRSHLFHQFEIWTKKLRYRLGRILSKRKIRWQTLPVARNVWRCVKSPTVPHRLFVSIVIGRGFCCTGRIYGWPVRTTRTYGPNIQPVCTAVCVEVW